MNSAFPFIHRIQHELEVTTKQAIFVDSSISDTIRTCIVLGNHRAANRVKSEFKVCIFQTLLNNKVTILCNKTIYTDVHARFICEVNFLKYH